MDLETLQNWIAEQWTAGLEAAIASMLSDKPAIRQRPPAAGEDAVDRTWWSQKFTGLAEAAVWVGATPSSWNQLGVALLAALGIEQPGESDLEGTCRDLVAQSGSALAQQLTGRCETQVSGGDVAAAQTPGAGFAMDLEISFPGSDTAIELHAIFGNDLAESALGLINALPEPAGEPAQAPVPEFPEKVGALPLRVHVTLGRTTLPLKDVFKLTVGSIVDLGQLITEPADVVVNGMVLARGQIVVIHGQYGLKVLSRKPNPRNGAAAA